MTPENEAKLQEIFRVVFAVEAERDVTSIRKLTERRWDSLAHVSLVAALESEFRIELTLAEQDRLGSYESALLLLDEKVP